MKRITKLIKLMRYSPAMILLRNDWKALLVTLIKKEILSDNYGDLSK